MCIRDRNTLIVDGEVFQLGGGKLAVEGQAAPPQVEAVFGVSELQQIYGAQMRDDGAVTALYFFFKGPFEFASIVMRDQRPVLIDQEGTVAGHISVDASGAAVTVEGAFLSGQRPVIRLESEVVMDRFPDLDLDLDGQADVLYPLGEAEMIYIPPSNEGGPITFLTRFQTNFANRFWGIARTRPARLDALICSGTPNSTGQVGQLAVTGSPLAADDELTLRLYDLPAGSLGFGLFSRLSGPPIQPGGSEGTVCLSGDIGRFLPGAFVTDSTGSAEVRPDLAAIPQPFGTVPVLAGETWYCQVWHRDLSMGAVTSNFSTAVEVSFQ